MTYLAGTRTVSIDMAKLSGPAVARWYDPASGRFRAIVGSPLPNQGTGRFTPPGANADGPGNEDGRWFWRPGTGGLVK
jgi:hypothetical protein